MTCFISWLPSNFSERRKNSREICWFLKSRKCVACVKSESYLLLSIPSSHFASALEGLALGEKTWRRQNLSQVPCLSPAPAPLLLSWLYIIHPRVYVVSGRGWSKMKTSQIQRNRFLMTEPRHHGDGQVMGMGWGRDIVEEWNCPTSTQITLGADNYS